ncbi:MAG: hypothetical protein ACYST6_19410 [Planctomycetota bacterium]|jgi:hypothetical protein
MMGCLSPKRQNAPPLPLRTKFVEAEPEPRKKKKHFGTAQRPEDLGVLSLSKGGRLGNSLFG